AFEGSLNLPRWPNVDILEGFVAPRCKCQGTREPGTARYHIADPLTVYYLPLRADGCPPLIGLAGNQIIKEICIYDASKSWRKTNRAINVTSLIFVPKTAVNNNQTIEAQIQLAIYATKKSFFRDARETVGIAE
ncbi:hypothetical protein IWW34DRAFT_584426, partial [Fusarium oxysporum f. sp. albedinis]